MSLIVEDGTGLSSAESYISVADANTYIAKYKSDVTTWDAATTTAKEIAARQATRYLDSGNNWKWLPLTTSQSLDWPRSGAYTKNGATISGVPTDIKNACAELMYLVVNGTDLTKNVTRDDRISATSVDVISVTYELGASQQTVFTEVSRMLAWYVEDLGNRIIRG